MALNKGIWDPTLRGTKIKGTNLKSLKYFSVLILPLWKLGSGDSDSCGIPWTEEFLHDST